MKRLESIRRHCGMINCVWNAFGAALIAVALLTGADAWAQTSRTIRIVVPFPAGGSAIAGRAHQQGRGTNRRHREPPEWWCIDRLRSSGPRGTGRKYSSHQCKFDRYQPSSKESELRSSHELRTNLLPLELAASNRCQQRVTVSHACRIHRRCACQTWTTYFRDCGTRDHTAHRL